MLPLPPRFIPPLGPPKSTPLQRVLAQWRGVNTAPLEKGMRATARPVSSLLPRVFKELRFDNRRSEAEIVKVWQTLMDPDVVAHAQPTNLRKGTLFVTVDSSAWLDEIVRYRRKEILDRLRHSFGPAFVQRISFRVG